MRTCEHATDGGIREDRERKRYGETSNKATHF